MAGPAAGAITATRTPFTLTLRTFATFPAAFPASFTGGPIFAATLLRRARLAFRARLTALWRRRFVLNRGRRPAAFPGFGQSGSGTDGRRRSFRFGWCFSGWSCFRGYLFFIRHTYPVNRDP
jgi:hypothetical protein